MARGSILLPNPCARCIIWVNPGQHLLSQNVLVGGWVDFCSLGEPNWRSFLLSPPTIPRNMAPASLCHKATFRTSSGHCSSSPLHQITWSLHLLLYAARAKNFSLVKRMVLHLPRPLSLLTSFLACSRHLTLTLS